ncbi:MAG: hypothetical protein ABJZ55_05645 [Fuerstiella sp.]
MCIPGELIFSEDFNPATVSERWGFKADFALRDGALLRTNVNPLEGKRVFLKDASFHNTIIQFDFKLSGKTTDLRLVTGSGGGYNSVTQIDRQHFQLTTPSDRDAGFVSAHLGECVRTPRPDQWQTMTVEYWNDEMVAHLSDSKFIVAKHPIINRTRQYFAFQFDLPGASIDNVRVWKAKGRHKNWSAAREKLVTLQNARKPVKRNPLQRYKIASINLKSQLTLNDPVYRQLVAKHDKLKADLQVDYSEAFTSHKQLSKHIAKKKKQLKEADPEFKRMEVAVNKARKAEDNYVLSTKPELERLKKAGIAKQRFTSELGQVRAALEAAGEQQLADLVAETTKRQTALEARFPQAFESVEAAVEKRIAKRKALNQDPEFQARNQAVVDTGKAIKEYLDNADPKLAELAAAAKAYDSK